MSIKENFLHIWDLIDPVYYHFSRLEYIENKRGERTIMRVRLTKYKGRDLRLKDGTEIHKNDLLIKIHLHNVKLLKQIHAYDNELRRALVTYKSVQDSMPSIVNYIQLMGYTNKIKGLIGITTLHKGCQKLGFEVYPIRNKYYKWFKQIALLPIYFLSCKKFNKEVPVPMYLLMSKDTLYKNYNE
ncbi:YkoP family protein [Oceanobacillus halophilus]|nr:hypothetical protein [Oceanobacillus halophilus]